MPFWLWVTQGTDLHFSVSPLVNHAASGMHRASLSLGFSVCKTEEPPPASQGVVMAECDSGLPSAP